MLIQISEVTDTNTFPHVQVSMISTSVMCFVSMVSNADLYAGASFELSFQQASQSAESSVIRNTCMHACQVR